MPFREINRNEDAKKISVRQELKLDNVGKKQETSQQREERNLRFYREVKEPQEVAKPEKSRTSIMPDWVGQVSDQVSRTVSLLWENKSALLLGVMLASARGINVEGRPMRGGTALRLLDSNNVTNLPSLGWEGFNNLSHSTVLHEYNPSKIPQAHLDRLKELVMTDQKTQNVQQRRYENNTSLYGPGEARGIPLKKKVRIADPRLRKGEISPSTRETHQEGQNKGKELLKPEEVKIASLQARKKEVKASQEVLGHVSKLLTERWLLREYESSVPRRELYNYGYSSIVFVHGFKPGPDNFPTKGSSSGWDCIKDYWGDAINFLSERGLTDFRTIKYYTGDTNCANGLETSYSSDLHNETYTKNCTDYPPGYDSSADGTNDESLYHLSCLFSQYLYYNFGQSNRDVIIVAHSMGGMITRGSLYPMDIHAGQQPFPDTIGQVTKAITFNSPHGGVYGIDALGCANCQQAQDLVYNSAFMSDLSSPAGLDPQPTPGLTTIWSVVGSECDNVVGGLLNPNQYANAIDMNANFALVYASGSDTCYDHGGALHDSDTKLDAKYHYCNTSETGGSPCGLDYHANNREWKETAKGLRGLQLMYYLISGLDIEQAGEGSSKKKALEIGLTVGGVTAVAVGAGVIAKIMKGGNGSGGRGDGHDGGGPQASTSGTAHIELAQQPEAQEVVADEHGDGHGDFDAAAQKLREDAAKLEENWEGKTFSAKRFADHYGRHAKEWSPALTEEQYVAKARELLSAPPDANIEGFVSESGQYIFKYNNATNEFAIGRSDGLISTFYKPDDGRAYWLDQIKKHGGNSHVFGGK